MQGTTQIMQFNSVKKVIYLHDCMIGMHLPPFCFHPKGEVPFVSTLEALEGTKYICVPPSASYLQ